MVKRTISYSQLDLPRYFVSAQHQFEMCRKLEISTPFLNHLEGSNNS